MHAAAKGVDASAERNDLCDAPATPAARAIHDKVRGAQDPSASNWLSPHVSEIAAEARARYPFPTWPPRPDEVAEAGIQALFGTAVRRLTWTALIAFAALLVLIVHATR